jgi:hypothetical protein
MQNSYCDHRNFDRVKPAFTPLFAKVDQRLDDDTPNHEINASFTLETNNLAGKYLLDHLQKISSSELIVTKMFILTTVLTTARMKLLQ